MFLIVFEGKLRDLSAQVRKSRFLLFDVTSRTCHHESHKPVALVLPRGRRAPEAQDFCSSKSHKVQVLAYPRTARRGLAATSPRVYA